MSSGCKIAIVGGGLAGLAAANALRTFGIKAEVFEAATALGEIGAAVNSSPQAVKALRAIGDDEVAAPVLCAFLLLSWSSTRPTAPLTLCAAWPTASRR